MAEKEEDKVPYTRILAEAEPERFAEIFSAASRKARETYFHRHGVRAPAKTSRLPKPGAKTEARILQLHEVLKRDDDDEMAEEILRNWLLTKRPMLAAALDHLGIVHDNGLTESDDVKKFEGLGKREVRTLADKLAPVASTSEVAIYLKFMGVKDVDAKLS